VDFDQDGVIDLALHAAPFVADPRHKDVFIEIDWMLAAGSHDHRPIADGLENVRLAFDAAPVTNPDGTGGIRLHTMVDELVLEDPAHLAITFRGNSAPGAGDDFDKIKFGDPVSLCPSGPIGTGAFDFAHIATPAERRQPNCAAVIGARRLTFHHALFAHELDSPTASGQGEVFGNDFVIAPKNLAAQAAALSAVVGPACPSGQTRLTCVRRVIEESLFMHELGHNLGLRHGGGDDARCKPNYLSIMSYALLWPQFDQARPLDYSRSALGTLDESSLSEPAGVAGAMGRNVVFGYCASVPPPVPPAACPTAQPARASAGGPIDWNVNGNATQTGVASSRATAPSPAPACCNSSRASTTGATCASSFATPRASTTRSASSAPPTIPTASTSPSRI
jgi:hypothetical protein